MELYKRCQPTIKKYSYVNGKFDEDLYQNLVIAFLGVIENSNNGKRGFGPAFPLVRSKSRWYNNIIIRWGRTVQL